MPSKQLTRYFFFLVAVFVASRIILYLTGVRFDLAAIEYYTQAIDPLYLRTKPVESLIYLHFQRPLFNILLAVVLNVFPSHYALVFQFIFLLVSLTLHFLLFHLMTLLKVREIIAFVLTALFMISPAVIYYENWLFYTYLIAFLLLFSAWALYQFFATKRFSFGFLFFMLLALLFLIKKIFGFYWFFLILIGAFLMFPRRKTVLQACALPLMIIMAFCLKDYMVHYKYAIPDCGARFYISNMAYYGLSDEERRRYEKEGKIGPRSAQKGWALFHYGENLFDKERIPATGIAVLDNFKDPNGTTNFNSIHQANSLKRWEEESAFILRDRPVAYLRSVLSGLTLYFFPGPTDVSIPNRPRIEGYENAYYFMFRHLNKINDMKLYSRTLLWFTFFDQIRWDAFSVILYTMVVLLWLSLVIFLAWRIKHAYRPRGADFDKAALASLIYILFNVVYFTVLYNLFGEFGHNRYRFPIDPFVLVSLGLFLSAIRISSKSA